MKRIVSFVLLTLMVVILVGCSFDFSKLTPTQPVEQTEPTQVQTDPPTEPPTQSEAEILLENMSGEYSFMSGAGAWATMLTLNSDGTFSGKYHDTDMGANGENYMYTVHACDFTGSFTDVEKINDYTYCAKVKDLEYDKPAGTEEIIDDCRYAYTDAYGIYGGDIFFFYTPDATMEQLPYEFKTWRIGLIGAPSDQKLGVYGIYNVTKQNGFYGSEVLYD